VLAVPTTALMAAWSSVPPAGYPFLSMVLDLPVTVEAGLDGVTARAAGLLLAAAADPRPDLDYAHVAYCARERGGPVVTSDARRIHAVDPAIEVELLP
jgi:hypothetical protein